jgi:peptidyl-prolyl cis-trans isomerase B (cyclophilin B)
MRHRFTLIVFMLLAMGTSGMVGAADDKKPTGGEQINPHAIIKTKFGEMEIKFFPDLAPKHVESFIKLAKSGFFDKTLFHRVIPGFMIQGGDPNTKDLNKKSEYGTGGPGYNLPDEFSATAHKRGILSMASSGRPNSAGSQFFIMVQDNPGLDRKYSVFGEIVKGMEVADRIVNAPRVVCSEQVEKMRGRSKSGDPCDMPKERIEMTVTVIEN